MCWANLNTIKDRDIIKQILVLIFIVALLSESGNRGYHEVLMSKSRSLKVYILKYIYSEIAAFINLKPFQNPLWRNHWLTLRERKAKLWAPYLNKWNSSTNSSNVISFFILFSILRGKALFHITFQQSLLKWDLKKEQNNSE